MPADLSPIDAALLDRWAGALARLAEGPTEYGPHDVEALAATTERMVVENARLKADLAEALATLANERGEGEPPCEGWSLYESVVGRGLAWVGWHSEYGIVVRTLAGWHWRSVHHPDQVYHRGEYVYSGVAATARAAIRDASAAKGGAR